MTVAHSAEQFGVATLGGRFGRKVIAVEKTILPAPVFIDMQIVVGKPALTSVGMPGERRYKIEMSRTQKYIMSVHYYPSGTFHDIIYAREGRTDTAPVPVAIERGIPHIEHLQVIRVHLHTYGICFHECKYSIFYRKSTRGVQYCPIRRQYFYTAPHMQFLSLQKISIA